MPEEKKQKLKEYQKNIGQNSKEQNSKLFFTVNIRFDLIIIRIAI